MSYLNSNYNANASRTNGQYVPAEQTKVKEETNQEQQTSAAENSDKAVSAEKAMDFLGAQGALNKALFLNVNTHKKTDLSQLNDAELSKAIESMVGKYVDEESAARIAGFTADFMAAVEEGAKFAREEFADISEDTANLLGIAGAEAKLESLA